MKKIFYTNTIITRGNEVLLGMKKRGFGQGFWNGFGGKVVAGEKVADAACREVLEECGLKLMDVRQVGYIHFESEHHHPGIIHAVHIFRSDVWQGEVSESEEMRPAWFAFDHVPYDGMWPDAAYWVPKVLAREPFWSSFEYLDAETLGEIVIKEASYAG